MTKQPKPRWVRLTGIGILGILCVGLTTLGASMSLRWSLLRRLIRWKFPDVQRVSIHTLAEWLQRPEKERPILLDVREANEYAVSHLKHAQHIPPDTPVATLEQHYAKNTLLAVYCSVGYRSSRMAQKLQQAGFRRVYNVEGSIFQWANEGRPVYQDGQRVKKVHPFDKIWGTFLESRYHATLQ